MHLRVILPVLGDSLVEAVRAEVAHWAAPGTRFDVVTLARGTASIESEYDEALAGPGILERVAEAVEDGVDGVFVDCFGDPAVPAAREIAGFPVVGGFEPAVLTALSLGERVGVLTVLPNVVPMLRSLARRHGVETRLGAIEVVNVPVLGLDGEGEELVELLAARGREAVARGQADVLVLGCTGMLGVAEAVRARLADEGAPVPVVDPTAAAVTWLERAHRLGLRPSRTTYLEPPAKHRVP
ncbi:aspartate/glutamate racemase family protein [Streptomyces cacaoi]|uniref:aspartate/glutamate racemase family protein n=1 Tax=Streptomyces cacaoi TaxID=1898 RepID=UPI0037493836